jgi:4-hydroxybenzoate-CoA ligase/benzoate-CoA ligase
MGAKTALIDDASGYSYADLQERVNRAGNALRELGLQSEQRVFICLADGIDFPAVFFGAMKAGFVAVPVNTMLTSDDYAYILADSRAPILVVSASLLERFEPIIDNLPQLRHVVVSGGEKEGFASLEALTAAAGPELEPANTTADDAGFWLYSSGSTGRPKGAVHLHRDLVYTVAYYAVGVLGMTADDVVFSAAKMFFAYGLGNTLSFPFYLGATAVVMAERPTPDSVMGMLKRHQPTIFYGVPTLLGAILADPDLTREVGSQRLRLSVSAGEALPKHIAERWEERFAAPVLDGIGSTEMLHIFISNRLDDNRHGTTGKPVPGYQARVVDEDGVEVGAGEIGELMVNGPSASPYYWNNREKSLATFHGPWTATGDKYICDEDGYLAYAGRSDDMLKVGGIWVSPFEVESALLEHDGVLEAAVVGEEDQDDLVKPKAFIVLKQPAEDPADRAAELQQFVKERLAPYKYPRWVEFVDALPKTATGKIQRFKLRN